MFCKISPLIKIPIIKPIRILSLGIRGYHQQIRSSGIPPGFIVMYKKQGQTIDDLKNQIENRLHISSLHVVEDLNPAYHGVVTFACGKSKQLLPYLDTLNTYTVSLSGKDATQTLPRRDFVQAMSCFIGTYRQKHMVVFDEKDPESYFIYSTPITVNDILIKKYTQSPITKIDLVLRCDQGCDVSSLLMDIERTIQKNTNQSLFFTVQSCSRTQHCGLKDSSPLCIDSEDVDSIEYVHSFIPPWFFINNMTMLQHMSVAYFSEMRVYREFKEQKQVSVDTSGIEYFERWNEEMPISMKPVDGLPVLLITPPQKTAKPIQQGRRYKTEINPAMLSGVGRFCKDASNQLFLKTELFMKPTPVTLMHVENTKSSNYFHKARKSKL